uniref:DUF7787 domain-containing protein n=1 Tax=Fagus sylvatica TaxID=28930 RepID=A0A2N9J512_FAGSY
MHGFKKIHKVPKKVLTDAVHTLDLVDPSRSTLNDNVSCLAFVALEDVMSDLNDLNWQECCVTSIQTLNSWKHCGPPPPPHPIKSTSGVSDVYGSTSSCVVGKLVPKRKRKRKRSNVVRGGADVGCSSASACVSLGSFGSS